MSKLKRGIVLKTANDIFNYVDGNPNPDEYHIAELINLNTSFLFGVIEELEETIDLIRGDEEDVED